MNSGIYKIVNKVNMKVYVGYTTNLYRRRQQHINELRYNKHGNRHLQKAFNKYGRFNFEFEVIELCNFDNLCFLEHYWCTILRSNDSEFGYNIKPTDPNTFNVPLSEETKKIMSNMKKGRKLSQNCIKANSKKVIDTITKKIYNSAKEVSNLINVEYSCFCKMLTGTKINKTIYKYL